MSGRWEVGSFETLHKAVLSGHDSRGGSVILVEDHTEMKWLEEELVHAARLASIPRKRPLSQKDRTLRAK